MATYVALADVNAQEFQNAQELVTVWGEIRNDVEELGGELLDSYALLGGYDFMVMYEVPDDEEEVGMQVALALERHGLNTRTMRAHSTDRLGELVEDI